MEIGYFLSDPHRLISTRLTLAISVISVILSDQEAAIYM